MSILIHGFFTTIAGLALSIPTLSLTLTNHTKFFVPYLCLSSVELAQALLHLYVMIKMIKDDSEDHAYIASKYKVIVKLFHLTFLSRFDAVFQILLVIPHMTITLIQGRDFDHAFFDTSFAVSMSHLLLILLAFLFDGFVKYNDVRRHVVILENGMLLPVPSVPSVVYETTIVVPNVPTLPLPHPLTLLLQHNPELLQHLRQQMQEAAVSHIPNYFAAKLKYLHSCDMQEQHTADCGKCQCAICLDSMNNKEVVARFQCTHLYHSTCINDTVHVCPQCRAIIAAT